MPKRGPTEMLILFQIGLGLAFVSMLVWTVLAWAGAF